MSEEIEVQTEDFDQPVESELDALKLRAETLGIKFHPAISLDKLRERVEEAMEAPVETPTEESGVPVATGSRKTVHNTGKTAEELLDDARKLVRVRVTCMNPAKREWEGEIFTAGNSIVGTHRKYVHYNTDWHVPNIIFKMMKARKCQVFTTSKARNGVQIRQSKMIPEFSIDVLEPLTEQELKELAQRQKMASGSAESI